MNPGLKTPDILTSNHGVDVGREDKYPEYGQVKICIHLNPVHSNVTKIGLSQAKELHSKLGDLIESIESERGTA